MLVSFIMYGQNTCDGAESNPWWINGRNITSDLAGEGVKFLSRKLLDHDGDACIGTTNNCQSQTNTPLALVRYKREREKIEVSARASKRDHE